MKPLRLPFFAAITLITAFSINSFAQMDSCNVFLKGQYVEVGISASGAYGSSMHAPAGYHGNCTGSYYDACGTSPVGSLGFVADPGMTGWTSFYGDYFLPGTPFEGWAIEINGGARADAFNTVTAGFTNGLSGTNTAYTASGSTVSGTWTGSLDSLNITQVTSLDTNNLYFTVTVILTNTAVAPMNNIYYVRSQDPDNDEVLSGNFETTNMVAYTPPSGKAVVTATGTVYTAAYMALGTVDSNARAFIYDNWPPDPSVSIASMYNETAAGLGASYTLGSTITGDVAIGLTCYVPHLAGVDSAADSVGRTTAAAHLHPANQATLTYFFAFTAAALDSAINAATTADTTSTLGIKNINAAASISVYPNPSKDIINITGLTTTDRLELYDMMGRLMDQNWMVCTSGTNTFSTSSIPTGAYILLVKDATGTVVARLPLSKL